VVGTPFTTPRLLILENVLVRSIDKEPVEVKETRVRGDPENNKIPVREDPDNNESPLSIQAAEDENRVSTPPVDDELPVRTPPAEYAVPASIWRDARGDDANRASIQPPPADNHEHPASMPRREDGCEMSNATRRRVEDKIPALIRRPGDERNEIRASVRLPGDGRGVGMAPDPRAENDRLVRVPPRKKTKRKKLPEKRLLLLPDDDSKRNPHRVTRNWVVAERVVGVPVPDREKRKHRPRPLTYEVPERAEKRNPRVRNVVVVVPKDIS
jgi:hypothetical protein